MEFDDVVQERASIRNFTDKKPKMELVAEAIDAANHAPSPGNLPILRYLVIEEPEKINEIARACQQQFIKKAQILVIVLSEYKKAHLMYDKRADMYIKQHAGAAIENFLLKITDLGLSSCWVGAFVEEMIRNVLLIPEGFDIEAILPVGYQPKADKTRQKEKFSLDNRLYFNEFKNVFQYPHSRIRREDI